MGGVGTAKSVGGRGKARGNAEGGGGPGAEAMSRSYAHGEGGQGYGKLVLFLAPVFILRGTSKGLVTSYVMRHSLSPFVVHVFDEAPCRLASMLLLNYNEPSMQHRALFKSSSSRSQT